MKRGGSFMPVTVREDIGSDLEYSRCGIQGLLGHTCAGRVTREHAIIHAGKKVQEKWAIVPLCASGHGVDFFQDAGTEVAKEVRVWMAVNRATDEELRKVSKVVSYFRERDRLNAKYGVYVAPAIPDSMPAYQTPVAAPIRRLTKEELFEREVKQYARINRLPVEDARAFLTD
jgi:hypothetical protein